MMTILLLSSIAFIVAYVEGREQGECFNVNTSTHQITDSLGRERYFHGMNVVVKGPPWIPQTEGFHPRWSFSEKDMQTFKSLGWNAVRLGMMWPGAEPQRDQFNETYFKTMKWIIEKAAEYGINILFDMHQDLLSAKFCGEGAPDWAIETGGAGVFPEPIASAYPIDPETGYPSKKDCDSKSWPEYSLTEAASAAYQHIYNNSNGLLDELAEFWSKVAGEFLNYSNILGYEIINEPWAGDIFHNPALLFPQVADKENLQRVYDVVSTMIWKNDPCHNVFFESVTWDEWTTGFERVPVDKSNAYRSIISYHIYFPPQINPDITFFFREEDMRRLNCGGFLTEFSVFGDECDEIMNLADTHLQSWTGWDYKPYYGITGDGGSLWYDNGTMNMAVASRLSRTYAPSVAGHTKLMSFDKDSKVFKLEFVVTNACKSQTTEIYLNEALHYPNGYTVSTNPVVTWNSPGMNSIIFNHNSTLSEFSIISIQVRPNHDFL